MPQSEKNFLSAGEIAELASLDDALKGILKVSSTFGADDVTAYVAERVAAHARSQGKNVDADELRRRVALAQETVRNELAKRTADGADLISLGESGRYTTREVMRQEYAILDAAAQLRAKQPRPDLAEAAFRTALSQGYGTFMEYPATDSDVEELTGNLRKILNFSDLGILNGPPGTGKSTICQATTLALLSTKGEGGLLPEGAKVYATSSNPKAADSLAKDLLSGLLVQDSPRKPDAIGENVSADERATYDVVMAQYVDTRRRYNKDMYNLAKLLGKEYKRKFPMRSYTAAEAASLFEELQGMCDMLDGDLHAKLIKKLDKLKARFAAAEKKGGQEKAEVDTDVFNFYIQTAYNNGIAQEKRKQVEGASLDALVKKMAEGKVPVGSCVIVDEAGLMGREDMYRLMTASAKAGVRLLLVGDNRQIPPQEAGHPFDLIVRNVATANGVEDVACSLTTRRILRQDSPAEARAGIDIRNGVAKADPPTGIYVYADKTYTHDYVQADGTLKTKTEKALDFLEDDAATVDKLIEDYTDHVISATGFDKTAKPSVLVLTTTQDKADVLSAKMREAMVQKGLLSGTEVAVGGMTVRSNDQIIFTALTELTNGKTKLRVDAGETAVCKTSVQNPTLVTLDFGKNRKITLDMADEKQRVQADVVRSAFALPLALAQGMSKKRAYLCLTEGDTLDEPNGLVAFTRHEKQMSAYVSKKAYKDIDALAKDIVVCPLGRNALDFVDTKGKAAVLSRIVKNKDEHRQAVARRSVLKQSVLRGAANGR